MSSSLFREFAAMQQQMHTMMREMDRQFGSFGGMPSMLQDDWDMPMLTGSTQPQQQQLKEGSASPATAAGKKDSSDEHKQMTTHAPSQQQQLSTRSGGSDWLSAPFGGRVGGGWLTTPAIDILAQDDKYIVKADLPAGLPKENVKLDLDTHRGVLTLSGQHSHASQQQDPNAHWIRRERSSGSFTRSLRLPNDVELKEGGKDLTAKFDNGVLELVLPRKAKTADPKLKETHTPIKIA